MSDSKKVDWSGNDAPRSDDIDWGGQAFPTEGGDQSGLYPDPGMSLRDYFAGQAIGSIVEATSAGNHQPHKKRDLPLVQAMALDAYEIADAMIAARKAGG